MKIFRFCIFISFLLLFYTVYKSEIYWAGVNRDYYLIYGIILIFLIIFFSIALQLNYNLQKYVLIILFSVVFALFLFEAYLCSKSNCFENYKKINNANYDKRSPIELYDELRKSNQNVSIFVPTYSHISKKDSNDIFPLAGISNSKTIHCNENGYYPIYQSDRYGFNNSDEEWNSNDVEYLLVGDSFTHGACVNRPDNIASVLKNLSQKSVLNLGYAGNGSLMEYATLREYLNPGVKKILWLYFVNDLITLKDELESKYLSEYFIDFNYSQNLKSKQNEIDKLLLQKITKEYILKADRGQGHNFKYNISRFFKLYDTRAFLEEFFFFNQFYLYSEFKSILGFANNLAASNNSKLYFVYLPSYREVRSGLNENSSKTKIKKIVTDLNIQFIDIYDEVMKKETNPLQLFSFVDSHYTVEGYKKVALKIYEKTK